MLAIFSLSPRPAPFPLLFLGAGLSFHRRGEFRSLNLSDSPTSLLSTPPRASPASLPLPHRRFFCSRSSPSPLSFFSLSPEAFHFSSTACRIWSQPLITCSPNLTLKASQTKGHQALGRHDLSPKPPCKGSSQAAGTVEQAWQSYSRSRKLQNEVCLSCYTMGHAELNRTPDHRALVSVWSQTPWTPRLLPLVQGSEKTFQRPTYELARPQSPLTYKGIGRHWNRGR